jgi:solute carrier family 24 (sodium/potassium/calcium exchanger), member 6
VGALEFQAVLKSLQKSRNIQTYPMNARRYSDDPTFTSAQQQDQMSSVSDPASRPPYQVVVDDGTEQRKPGNLEVPYTAPAVGRGRAVSANDVQGLRIDPDIRQMASPERLQVQGRVSDENLIDLGERDAQAQSHQSAGGASSSSKLLAPPSPSIEFSPAEPQRQDTMDSVATRASTAKSTRSSQYLHLPGDAGGSYHSGHRDFDELNDAPQRVPTSESLPRIIIPRRQGSHSSTPSTSPFPRFRDSPSPLSSRPPSLYLPQGSIGSPESLPASQSAERETPKRPTLLSRWWPHTVLPPPGVLISTLFPTIYHWREKNYWEKALGIVAAPSVFLLTITLPVVESSKDEDDGGRKDDSLESARSKSIGHNSAIGDLSIHGTTGMGNAATVATSTEQQYRHNAGSGPTPDIAIENISGITLTEEPQAQPAASSPAPELWNRWLLITQLFLAPIFVVLSIYTQSPTDITPRWLIRPILICLLISLVLLIPLLLTTTPTHKPRIYRYILSLAGFVVSIAWISTIAGQVVGALKALAVILNMSHAIMGLTIFAVGNSLGDLVADVTVARLGYPVMALSACFGGPMLNILLGIGLSGSYILIRGANHRMEKHPDKDFKFKSYHIDVGNTLIVSGGTLLFTLVGLLIFVPMNRWVMSKRIGWTLIAVWVVSTVGNVVLEVTGVADGGSDH